MHNMVYMRWYVWGTAPSMLRCMPPWPLVSMPPIGLDLLHVQYTQYHNALARLFYGYQGHATGEIMHVCMPIGWSTWLADLYTQVILVSRVKLYLQLCCHVAAIFLVFSDCNIVVNMVDPMRKQSLEQSVFCCIFQHYFHHYFLHKPEMCTLNPCLCTMLGR